MISDILDSSSRRGSPRQRCSGDCSDPEEDAASEDRDHGASTPDPDSAAEGEGEQSKLLLGEDGPSEASPKSSGAGSPGEG